MYLYIILAVSIMYKTVTGLIELYWGIHRAWTQGVLIMEVKGIEGHVQILAVYLRRKRHPLYFPVSPDKRLLPSGHGGSVTASPRPHGTRRRSAPWRTRRLRRSLSVWRRWHIPAPVAGTPPWPRRCSSRPRTPGPRLPTRNRAVGSQLSLDAHEVSLLSVVVSRVNNSSITK
jgi:hypothetical protein